MSEDYGKDWLCIRCGERLGIVLGNELSPRVPCENVLTRGANLSVKCPQCGTTKIFYTADPVVKAMYQLVDVLGSLLAERALREIQKKS